MQRSCQVLRGATLAIVLATTTACVEPTRLEGSWTSMGKPASAEIHTTTERSAVSLLEEFPGVMEKVEQTFSVGLADSDLNRINREAADGYLVVENHDLYRAIGLALDYARASEGVFDPTIGSVSRLYRRETPPTDEEISTALADVDWTDVVMERGIWSLRFGSPATMLDLTGMDQGYALDVAVRKFVRAGSLGGLLRLGDHLYAWGKPSDADAWNVWVNDPRESGRSFVRLGLRGRAVAVSAGGGDSELVLDPRTGRPFSSDVRVALAVADSAADAVVISRAMLVGGSRRAGALLARTNRVEAVLLVTHGSTYLIASASLDGRIELSDAVAAETKTGPRFLLPPADL